jgi:hypothetical protein
MRGHGEKLAFVAAMTMGLGVAIGGVATVTFDEPGYVAGSAPPAPWTDRYTAAGQPFADLVYTVVAGRGVGGTQALTVEDNPYYEGAAVFIFPEPLLPAGFPQRVSVMLDPSANSTSANFTSFGGVSLGRGGWAQDSTAVFRGVNFLKEDWGMRGGDQPTDFIVYGPGGTFGYFVPASGANYYEIAFNINAAFTSMQITVTPPGGGGVITQTTSWDGGGINKIWLWDSNDHYQPDRVYYDDLSWTVVPEPSLAVLSAVLLTPLLRRR